MSGVGFFHVKHGQSGVAPNAIELHPVLARTIGGPLGSPPPAPPPATSKPAPSSGSSMRYEVAGCHQHQDDEPGGPGMQLVPMGMVVPGEDRKNEEIGCR